MFETLSSIRRLLVEMQKTILVTEEMTAILIQAPMATVVRGLALMTAKKIAVRTKIERTAPDQAMRILPEQHPEQHHEVIIIVAKSVRNSRMAVGYLLKIKMATP